MDLPRHCRGRIDPTCRRRPLVSDQPECGHRQGDPDAAGRQHADRLLQASAASPDAQRGEDEAVARAPARSAVQAACHLRPVARSGALGDIAFNSQLSIMRRLS